MAEKSFLWTTDGTGDGAATYTRSDWSDIAEILTACHGAEGVAAGYLNSLAGTAPSLNAVWINTGAALVDGKPYLNTASKSTAIPSAVGGGNTRIDRIVLRATWGTTQTVRITRIAGTDAATPSAPAITQISKTTYDILLYRVLVNTAGTITLTDERVFGQVPTAGIADLAVTSGKLAANAVIAGKVANGAINATAQIADNVISTAKIIDAAITLDKMANNSVDPQKIVNRVRTVIVPATDGLTTPLNLLQDGVTTLVGSYWRVPQDFVSQLMVAPVVAAGANGNINADYTYYWEAVGEAWMTHNLVDNSVVTALTLNMVTAVNSKVLNVAAGDIVRLIFTRNGAAVTDTMASSLQFFGWQVSYTSDGG